MDFGDLISRSAKIVWEHKFLILLGVIVVLTGGGAGGGGGNFTNFGADTTFQEPGTPPDFEDFENFEPDLPPEFEDALEELAANSALLIGVIAAVTVVAIGIGLILWVIRRTAEGALIAGVNGVELEGTSSFGTAWSAGWGRMPALLLIDLILSLPIIILVMIMVGTGIGVAVGASQTPEIAALLLVFIPLCCVLVIAGIVIGVLRQLADRACVIDGLAAVPALEHGVKTLRENPGDVVLVALIQFGLGLGIGLVLAIPGFILAFCCVLWPLLWAVNGAITSFFSAFWTLAWRQWMGNGEPTGEPLPAV